jgi:hypothetical protein
MTRARKQPQPETAAEEAVAEQVVEEPSAAAEPESQAHEVWAERKGFTPEMLAPPSQKATLLPTPGDSFGSYQAAPFSRSLFGARVNPRNWEYRAAVVRYHWPINKAMTETDFDAAIATVTDPNITQR